MTCPPHIPSDIVCGTDFSGGSIDSRHRYLFALALLPRHSELELVNTEYLALLDRELVAPTRKPELVDEAFYAQFVALTDRELRLVTKALLRGLADYFNAIVEHGEPGDGCFEGFLDAALYMVAIGALAFGEPGEVLFIHREGSPPSFATHEAIAERIRSVRPWLMDILREVCRRGR